MDQDFCGLCGREPLPQASLTGEPANNNADKQQQNKRLLGIVRNMI
jgi:hypothetical protein